MKRFLCLLIMVFLLFVGCTPQNGGDASSEISSDVVNESSENGDASRSEDNKSASVDLPVNAQYIRTDGEFDGDFVSALANSVEELNSFYESNKDKYYLERRQNPASDFTIGFLDACDKYDADFFENNYLLIIRLVEPSGSNSHKINKVQLDNGSLLISIARIVPEVGTCDVAGWHIIVEIGKEYSVESVENAEISVFDSLTALTVQQIDFALDLFKSCFDAEKESFVVSPLSVQLALAITANGANGETKAEMEAVLGDFKLDDLNILLHDYINSLPNDEKYKLAIANSIWCREGFAFKEDFLEKNESFYDAEINSLAFDDKAVESINAWVNENTDGMIEEIIDSIDDKTIMYLINAICFDAEWSQIYFENSVRNGEFIAYDGETRNASMMYSDEWIYISDEKASGFIKNYKNNKYGFAVLLPDEGVDIYDYVAEMSAESMLDTLNNQKRAAIHAGIPKFESEFEISLVEILKNSGMKNAFDCTLADFSGMIDSVGGVYISDVIHKAFIGVNEKGTRAGAATAVSMDNYGIVEYEYTITLDRPFVYMILDNATNTPIFIGALTDIR